MWTVATPHVVEGRSPAVTQAPSGTHFRPAVLIELFRIKPAVVYHGSHSFVQLASLPMGVSPTQGFCAMTSRPRSSLLFTNIGEIAHKVSDFISEVNGWCAPSHPGQVKTTVGEMLSVMGSRDTLAGRLFSREHQHIVPADDADLYVAEPNFRLGVDICRAADTFAEGFTVWGATSSGARAGNRDVRDRTRSERMPVERVSMSLNSSVLAFETDIVLDEETSGAMGATGVPEPNGYDEYFTSGPSPSPPGVDRALQLARENPGVRVTTTQTYNGAPRLDFRAHSDAGRGPRPRGQDPLNLQW